MSDKILHRVDRVFVQLIVVIAAVCLCSCSNMGPGVSTPVNKPIDCEKVSIANPAASYCRLMGYEYDQMIVGQDIVGVCKFPDGTSCPQWDFYTGKCGQKYSYCVKNGYGIITGTDGNDPFSIEYSICVDENGGIIGSATKLIGLTDSIDKCN